MLSNGNGLSAADVAAVTGNNGWNNGFGGDGAWWIIVLLLCANGGWGNGMFGGGGMGWEMPYFYNSQTQNDVNRGFDNQGLSSAITALTGAVTGGFADAAVQQCNSTTQLLQGQNGTNTAMLQGFASAAQQACQDKFDIITTANNNYNNLVMQAMNNEAARQKCCCDEQLRISELRGDLLADNANTRLVVTQQAQEIKDIMCQDKIDAKNERIVQLENQNAQANLLNAINQSQAQQTQQIEDYVRPQINPAYIVPNPYANYFNPYGNGNWGWNNGGCNGCNTNYYG